MPKRRKRNKSEQDDTLSNSIQNACRHSYNLRSRKKISKEPISSEAPLPTLNNKKANLKISERKETTATSGGNTENRRTIVKRRENNTEVTRSRANHVISKSSHNVSKNQGQSIYVNKTLGDLKSKYDIQTNKADDVPSQDAVHIAKSKTDDLTSETLNLSANKVLGDAKSDRCAGPSTNRHKIVNSNACDNQTIDNPKISGCISLMSVTKPVISEFDNENQIQNQIIRNNLNTASVSKSFIIIRDLSLNIAHESEDKCQTKKISGRHSNNGQVSGNSVSFKSNLLGIRGTINISTNKTDDLIINKTHNLINVPNDLKSISCEGLNNDSHDIANSNICNDQRNYTRQISSSNIIRQITRPATTGENEIQNQITKNNPVSNLSSKLSTDIRNMSLNNSTPKNTDLFKNDNVRHHLRNQHVLEKSLDANISSIRDKTKSNCCNLITTERAPPRPRHSDFSFYSNSHQASSNFAKTRNVNLNYAKSHYTDSHHANLRKVNVADYLHANFFSNLCHTSFKQKRIQTNGLFSRNGQVSLNNKVSAPNTIANSLCHSDKGTNQNDQLTLQKSLDNGPTLSITEPNPSSTQNFAAKHGHPMPPLQYFNSPLSIDSQQPKVCDSPNEIEYLYTVNKTEKLVDVVDLEQLCKSPDVAQVNLPQAHPHTDKPPMFSLKKKNRQRKESMLVYYLGNCTDLSFEALNESADVFTSKCRVTNKRKRECSTVVCCACKTDYDTINNKEFMYTGHCGHLMYCRSCLRANRSHNCTICHQSIHYFMKIFV